MTSPQTRPGHRALRRGRVSLCGQIYLLTWTTRARHRRFDDFQSACRVSATLADRNHWRDARLLAWVLMPDHVHALVELGAEPLADLVSRIKYLTALAARGPGGEPIRLWSRGFHDHALRRDECVHRAARYVVANPVRAGLVKSVRHYPFWDAVWL